MSREGGNSRIDSLKNSLNSDHYQRTALGSAVRFNTMLNLLDDLSDEVEEEGGRRPSRREFSALMDSSVNSLLDEFNEVTQDDGATPQQELQNRAYKTALGQTIAKATTQRKGLYQDFNTSYSTGATGAFRSFTNGFVQDDEDYFGSRVLYDNVFGNYEDGTESLSNRKRMAMSDPFNDNRSVGEKVLDDVVNKSIYDQTEIIDRVDIEFGRFHGQSIIDQYSMSGSGLRSARQTIRAVMQEGSAYGRQVAARGESDDHPATLAQTLLDRTNQDIDSTKTALNLLNNNLGNRSGTNTPEDGGYVNKAGVAEFIDLINSAGSRDGNGSLTGGRISISSFQFQNETISAALSDKIQRHVLESVLDGGGAPLQIDLTLAYPRQRTLDSRQDQDGRYAVGQTNYGILGPNLIEAIKLQEVKEDVESMLRGLGVAPDQIDNYVNLNIEFRDKKFHPKVYLTDNRASIGTQNLTAPVGKSVNQAGSNFETMRFVDNTYVDDNTLRSARQQFNPLNTSGNIQNNSITQSLLYRQIVDSVNQEREYNNGTFLRGQGNTSTPILTNQQGSQVGFAGDIYQHLHNTLNFAHSTSFGWQSKEASKNSMHMFMVLDQAFMLQLGSNSYSKQLKGEMGNETGIPYSDQNQQSKEYQKLQSNLFDLIIGDKASVVVDTKNYKEQILKPISERIYEQNKDGSYKNQRLISNYEKHGKSLNALVGFDLFRPSNARSQQEYDSDLSTMFSELRRLGFTQEAGFNDTDLKQLIGLASGNIEMAAVPRQHAKEFGLVQYGDSGPELISYYQGSSNMGLYSLGINSGVNGEYQKGDGDLTNSEMGIMLGRRDIHASLSRTSSSVAMSEDFKSSNNILGQNIQSQEWLLNSQEEQYELGLAQRHLSVTWNQLSQGTFIEDPRNKKNIGKPSWQDNVNSNDLNILRQRLETLGHDLGLDSRSFSITERFGNVSGSGVTSINVSIDIAKSLNINDGFISAGTNIPKINFELTVLQGPQRGNGIFSDSTDDGSTPGFVYFVDKDKVVGNGLFVNESGQNISVLGRNNYDSDFKSDINNGGRIDLKSGASAHMSSLDIVPQLFATLMGEGVSRFGAGSLVDTYNNLDVNEKQGLLIDYVSNMLTGRTSQIDESIETGSNVRSALTQVKENLNLTSLQDLNETVNRHARALENKSDSILLRNRNVLHRRAENAELTSALAELNNNWSARLKGGNEITDGDVFDYISDLNRIAETSPQLANAIMKTSYRDKNSNQKVQAFKEFQNLLFGSFLQTKDDSTYGGQQGFYRTTLMGVGSNEVDKNTAALMFDLELEPSLLNLNAYARFKPLEYTPLTNIHEGLYRSIASKSTSMGKNNADLDSHLFESEARDLGDASNLRLMSSIGIGNIRHRDDYIIRNELGNLEIGKDQASIFKAMGEILESSGSDMDALNKAREAYLNSMSQEFGDIDSDRRQDTIRLSFYTGSSKKLSQLPQRIKNAMGARPMYQYSVEAQMALERGESLNDLSSKYLQKYRDPLLEASKDKVKRLLEQRESLLKTNTADSDVVRAIDSQIDDLKVIGSKAFNGATDGLGAVFSGKIKSVLNQEQISFIVRTRERLEKSIGDLIQQGELAEDTLDELVRIEVIKAGFTNKGLGKMISGSNHMNYSIALVQLSGTYNDTFSANPLYGTTYKSEQNYNNIRANDLDVYDSSLTAADRDKLGVYNLGMKEGQFETRSRSIKSSKIGAGGMEVQIQADDIVVEDKSTGLFVHKRKVNDKWVVINQADDKRNLQTIANLIDDNRLSPVDSPSLGSATEKIYGRKGQNSMNYIYGVDSREGNFANNEYLLNYSTLTSVDPSSGQRVEGTDASALIKGVAMFAGRIKYNSMANNEMATREMNVFENLEDQIIKSYEQGQLGGSLKSYLDKKDVTQKITLQDGRTGYAPLSSSIHGVYNANNFKSFFWSHGATLLKSQDDQGNKFMLDGLFDNSTESSAKVNAKKLVGALMLNFGTSFIQEQDAGAITDLKRTLVGDIIKGDFGSHYQKLVLGHAMTMEDKVSTIFKDSKLSGGRSEEQIAQDLLFEKIGGASGFSNTSLGALNILTSSQLRKVLQGDIDASNQILNLVRKGVVDPVSEKVSKIGAMNFTNSADTQAALVVTAVDFMHQLSSQGSRMSLPSDIDFDNSKVREVLLNVIGLGHNKNDQLTQDIMDFLSGVNSDVTALSVFADITFAYGKDPIGTQSIGRHESQHLITPFLGDIEKYREGGQLSGLQHTVAELAALVTKTGSGLVFYDQMAKVGFNDKQALNLVSQESDYLFSSFNKQSFLGFYQQGVSKISTTDYVEEYKNINKLLMNGSYDWESMQTVRDANDRTKLYTSDDGQDSKVPQAYKQVERYINKFHAHASETQKARLFDTYLDMGGDRFALHQLDELTNMMILENSKYQADSSKSIGVDSITQFLDNMNNKQMFFSIPDVNFEMQNGEIVATPSNRLISTILPSADDMRILGGEYSGFVDAVVNDYRILSQIFVPGTLTNAVFEKVRLATRENRAIILSTEEYKAFEAVSNSAKAMPVELKKATAGARTQEAFGGKNKYEGFTATGIGNLLMPFGSVVAPQTKLDDAGLRDNSNRFEAIQSSNQKIRDLEDMFKVNSNLISSNEDKAQTETSTAKIRSPIEPPIKRAPRSPIEPPIKRAPRSSIEPPIKRALRSSIELEVKLEVEPKSIDLTSSIDFLMKAVADRGVNFETLDSNAPNAPKGALGAYMPKSNTIFLKDGLSGLDKASTLLHELVHVYQTQDDIPLMGLKFKSSYANPAFHRSKSSDSNLNLKEWQAHSIEHQFRDLVESGKEDEAFNYVKNLVDSLNSKHTEGIETTFTNLGLSRDLNSANKKFTVNKSKDTSNEILYSKSENKKLKINDSEEVLYNMKNDDSNKNRVRLEYGPGTKAAQRIRAEAQVDDGTGLQALNKNILNFYRRQKSAEAFGISTALQKEFEVMKIESIKTKNQIISFAAADRLSAEDKKAAFETLKEGIKQKRDIAYNMARIDVETGASLSNSKDGYSDRVLSEQDRYIYHAQALNYDSLLTSVMIIGHEADINPLSKEVFKHLEKTREEFTKIEFLLNSFEDKGSTMTFPGLNVKQSEITQDALFNGRAMDPNEGMVGRHMKALKQIGGSFKGLRMPDSSKDAKLQYSLQQIDNSIEMYKKRSEDMQAFSVERESYSTLKDIDGKDIVDPAVQRKINAASSQYTTNTKDIISYLEDQKAKLLNNSDFTDQDLKHVFEDIDAKIAENDRANLYLAEVFRSPPLGGTDPRLHTYQLMQGIQSLNVVSQMLSDTRQTGTQPKMMYSTERGQTATVMAALGVTTLGGGDFDGDPYTTIFTQMAPTQKAIQDRNSDLDRYTITLKNLHERKSQLKTVLAAIDRNTEEGLQKMEDLDAKIDSIDESIEKIEKRIQNTTSALNEARQTLDSQLKVGHNNFTARARKQVANYMGIDEAFFVAQGEVMSDAYGNIMIDEDGKPKTGINMDKTYDADAMVVFGEKGYDLMEGIASSNKNVITIMNNMDVLLGHRGAPEAFNNGEFLNNIIAGINTVEGKISNESPAIGLLKDRVSQLQNSTTPLTPEQKMFVNSLKDAPDEQYKAYLQQFNELNKAMEADIASHTFTNQQLTEEARRDYNKRAFINQWIGGNLYGAMTSDATLSKFMAQGNGMTLTEGTFDMTLKTLGKAGGEVLGKTYNTLVGTTFQDAPVITYGRQMLEDGDLAQATKSEFARQIEGDSEHMAMIRQEVVESGISTNDSRFNEAVKKRIQDKSLSAFETYQDETRQAVLKSEGVQAFTKNIHQLLRDSIKLKDGDGNLINNLRSASETYDELSKQIAANDRGEKDAEKRTELINARDKIISGMASNLGPGPGLKSLIDLDYLTNSSDATGLSKNDFEQRFLTNGGVENNRQMLIEYSNSMGDNLTEQEKAQLRSPESIQDDSSALLKVARNMTARNISNMVTSFRMDQTAVAGRGEQLRNFANSHKANLATKSEIHSVEKVQTLKSRTEDGAIDVNDEAGKYIQSKYGLIELEGSAGTFDANRQHKNALGIHLGIEESHMYNEDGSVSGAYRTRLKEASQKLGISSEEYTLMFDIHHEQSRDQISGLFGQDGEKMQQFTVMNMMRKDIARAMMNGRPPSAKNSQAIQDNLGSEALTTMAQLAASGQLDSQGMEVFSGMYKGVMGNLLEATDSVVEYRDKNGDGTIKTMQFSHMTTQQKSAYLNKLTYQTMLGTQQAGGNAFNRSTSEEARHWKNQNADMIANSVLELDDNGRLSNDFIDALDKAGAGSSTGVQVRQYAALGEEYLISALDNDVQREALLTQFLPNKGELGTKESEVYRKKMDQKIRSQMKHRQEVDSKKYAAARSRHSVGRGIMQRSSFMNKINTSAIDQLSTDSSANALDLFVPLALTMVGSAISEGSIDKEDIMQLGGATFTAFQYARTGTMDSTNMDVGTYKKRLATAQAIGGIFKFKNALAQHGDENVGMAVAQVAVQETTAIAFNAVATPWLSRQIAERGLGVKHAPAMNSLDMRKYQASHQLAGNLGASLISAVSSTLISGLLMRGVESMSQNLGDTIQSFLPAANAVNSVNESISKRRQQEAAYADFEADTDGTEEEVKDYMVLTSSSYDTTNYAHLAEINEPQEIQPSMDGNLTVDLLV